MKKTRLHEHFLIRTTFLLFAGALLGIPGNHPVQSLAVTQAATTVEPYTEEEEAEIASIEQEILKALESGTKKVALKGYHITTDRLVEGQAFD